MSKKRWTVKDKTVMESLTTIPLLPTYASMASHLTPSTRGVRNSLRVAGPFWPEVRTPARALQKETLKTLVRSPWPTTL